MISLTDAAAEKIRGILKTKNISEETGGVRFGVKGGGCAGFQYFFEPCASPDSSDTVFEHNGAKLFIDAESMKFVGGSHIDWGWVDHLFGEGFIIKNPNASGSCGCGTSIQFKT